MAKVGEGDSRWIVSQRADGKNVGNWHWTEKNLFPFTEKRAKELFNDVTLITDMTVTGGRRLDATVTRCERCEGESSVMNRKGKLLFLFDLSLTLRYEATLSGDDKEAVKCKGEVTIKDIATDESTPTLKVTSDESVPAKDAALVSQSVRGEGRLVLMRIVDTLLQEMRAQVEGVQAPMVMPAPETSATAAGHASASASASASSSVSVDAARVSSSNGMVSQCLECLVPARELFAAFVDPKLVMAYTGAPATLEARVSAPLALYGGSVRGEVLACEPHTRLVWRWRTESWPAGAVSTVTLHFDAVDSARTKLTLTHEHVPRTELERTRAFWDEQFWTRMRALFGWRMTAV